MHLLLGRDEALEGLPFTKEVVDPMTNETKAVPATYYVFELDKGGNPVAGSKAEITIGADTRDYVVSSDDKAKVLNHEAPEAEVDITNAYTQRGKMAFVKVDKDSWDTANETGTPLGGAVFTLTMIDEDKPVMEGGQVVYKTYGPNLVRKQSVLTDPVTGEASIADLADGYYEGKETTAPPGYLLVGDMTVYVRISGGKVTFLNKGEVGSLPSAWTERSVSGYTYTPDNNTVMDLEAEGADPAKVTIGNPAGPELPSTGGPGLYPLLFVGLALALASALALALDRGHWG